MHRHKRGAKSLLRQTLSHPSTAPVRVVHERMNAAIFNQVVDRRNFERQTPDRDRRHFAAAVTEVRAAFCPAEARIATASTIIGPLLTMQFSAARP